MASDSPSALLWREAREKIRTRSWDEADRIFDAIVERASLEAGWATRVSEARDEVDRYRAAITSPLPADRTVVMMEPLDGRPDSLFTFQVDRVRYVGRKLISTLWLDDRIDELFCSRVTSPMILGELLEERLTSDGVLLFFRSVSPEVRDELHARLRADGNLALDFPWPPFGGTLAREAVATNWTLSLDDATRLDAGEEHLRIAAVDAVRRFVPDPKSLADPACSTGAFLASMQRAFPAASVFGMDLDASMAAVAATRIGRVEHGDGIDIGRHVQDADVLFCRFLNARVVTTRTAFQVLPELALALREGGHLVVFGHTPVLLPIAYLKVLGFDVKRATAHDGDSVFQMIVAQKPARVRKIGHPWFLARRLATNGPALP